MPEIFVNECGKLSTRKKSGNRMKSSYALSYPHYPQKTTKNYKGKFEKIRIYVLSISDKLKKFLKKT